MELIITMPTTPRRRDGRPSGCLTRTLQSLAATLAEASDVNVQVLLMDCSAPNDVHDELETILATPPPGLNLAWFRRENPHIDLGQVESLVSPDRIQRDGLEVTRWTYQQSADFLELMGRSARFANVDWHVRVEDDAVFSTRWVARMLEMTKHHPDCPLFSLFGIRLRFDGQVTTHHTGAVALAFRPASLDQALSAVRDHLRDLPFDVALGNLAGKVLYPSLVQHIGDVRSTNLGHPSGMWTSPTFRESDHPVWTAAWQCRIAWMLAHEATKRAWRHFMRRIAP